MNYFIQVQTNNAEKNKLDKMLHEAFKKYPGNIISDENLEILDNEHEMVVNQYQENGGKAAAPRYWRYKSTSTYDTIHVTISDSYHLILYPVKGEITPF